MALMHGVWLRFAHGGMGVAREVATVVERLACLRDLYKRRSAVERELGRLKHDWSLAA